MLQPLTCEQLRYGLERILLDVQMFNPHASSNRSAPRATVYQRHEKEKRRHYEECVRNVEQVSFIPVVILASGGMGKAASELYARIAALLAAKKPEQYCHVIDYVRCKLSFLLFMSCTMCLRGCRKLFGHPVVLEAGALSAALAVSVAQVNGYQ